MNPAEPSLMKRSGLKHERAGIPWNFVPRTPVLLAAFAACCALPNHGLGQEPGHVRSDVSISPAVSLPAFNVDEPKSAKTHTLFMGADIAVNLDKDVYQVCDVVGSNWVVRINGYDKEISAREAPTNLKITPSLKLTENAATVTGFTRVQSYSYGNDPSVLLTRGLSQSAAMSSDLLASAENAQDRTDTGANHSLGGATVLVGADDQFSANALMQSAMYAYSNSHPDTNFPLASPTAPTAIASTAGNPLILPADQVPAHILRAQYNNETVNLNQALSQVSAGSSARQSQNGDEPVGKIVTTGLDAMDVSFDIRSPKTLFNPYAVTMTRFRVPGGKPNMVQNMVYARSLNPIDEHVSHVHFTEEGFPVGFEVIDFQLHIYNRGEEIATNVAQDRVELTRDEAFEYIKMEYIGSHRGQTVAAAPAMARLPADLPSLLSRGKYATTFYVKVSKEGLALEAFHDAACRQRISDPYLDSVVQRIRFKPALDAGRPVEGVAALDLRSLPF